MDSKPQKPSRLSTGISAQTYLWSMVVILLVATALRVYALNADMPLHISLSQGATTDGPITVGAGRNMALFGFWNPEGQAESLYYLFPALSVFSYWLFSLLGVGLWQANLLTVIAGILTIAFTAGYANEQFGRRASLITAIFLAANYVYLMFNRTSVAYTPLTCGLAMALYFWQRGLRNDWWFAVSGLVLALSILFVKILGLALLPALGLGLLLVFWRRRRLGLANALGPLLLFGLGIFVGAGLWYLLIYLPQSQMINTHWSLTIHTFEPEMGIGENIRFAVQSVLQFGVRSGFFLQMLPLFALAYLYILVRGTQILTAERPRLEPGHAVALLALVSAVLTLLASANRPTRYMVILIPPLSLVAGLALDRWLSPSERRWPTGFGRFLPPLLMLGLAYFYYQLLTALDKLIRLLQAGTGLADARAIANGVTLFRLMGLALVLGVVTTIFLLRLALRGSGRPIGLPSKRARLYAALALVVAALLVDGVQYITWARSPAFSILQASRQVEQDLGPDASLGGPYAYVLTVENEIESVLFYPHYSPEVMANLDLTHMAMESDSIFNSGAYNDERMHTNHLDLMEGTQLTTTYTLRGYFVKVYELLK